MDACLDYLRENGAEPALVIDPHTVVTAPWTTFKCQFGCENFGKNHCCPPEAPDYTRTRAVLDSFSTGILFRVHHWNATAMAAEGARLFFAFSGKLLKRMTFCEWILRIFDILLLPEAAFCVKLNSTVQRRGESPSLPKPEKTKGGRSS